jgi:hypothetical protein
MLFTPAGISLPAPAIIIAQNKGSEYFRLQLHPHPYAIVQRHHSSITHQSRIAGIPASGQYCDRDSTSLHDRRSKHHTHGILYIPNFLVETFVLRCKVVAQQVLIGCCLAPASSCSKAATNGADQPATTIAKRRMQLLFLEAAAVRVRNDGPICWVLSRMPVCDPLRPHRLCSD